MVKCLFSTSNPVLRVAICKGHPAVVSGSLQEPEMQPGIQALSVIHIPQNGIVYGFALWNRHGVRQT